MTSHLLRLSESDLRSMVTALRSGRLTPPFPSVALQRMLPIQLASQLSSELQGLHDQDFTPGQIATTIELLLQDRSERPVPEDRPLPEIFYDPRSLAMPADKRTSLHAKCGLSHMVLCLT